MEDEMASMSDQEEGMIDSLFFRCDTCEDGRVQVHTVIQFLKNCLGNGNNEPDLLRLTDILEDGSHDGGINLHTYRNGVKLWITEIRNRCESTSFLESEGLRAASLDHSSHNASNSSEDVSMCIETSGTGDGSFNRREQELVELVSQIDSLKYQNHRLTEENTQLNRQIETQEETSAHLASELHNQNKDAEQLKKKVKSLQESVTLGKVVLEDNEELKCKLARMQDVKRDLDVKLVNLERENSNLENQSRNFENKWQKSISELETTKKDMQDIQVTSQQQKHQLYQLQESRTVQDDAMSQKTKELNAVKEKLNELLEQNEKLQDEKDDVHLRLTQTTGRLHRYQSKAEQLGLTNNRSVVDGDQSPDLLSPSPKHLFNSPLTNHSICMELKDRLKEDKHLPSPLCEKMELSHDVPFYRRSVVLPTYMSAWELDFSGSIGDYSAELLRNRKSLSPVSALCEVDIEKKLSSLKNLEKDALHKEIIRLYRVNVDLAEKCHKSELRETELHEEYTRSNHKTSTEKEQSNNTLEHESPESRRLIQDIDIKELWKLVHHVDDDSSQSDASSTSEQIRQQIRQELEVLTSKLHKQQNGEKLPVLCNGRIPSSQLLDALNIDYLTLKSLAKKCHHNKSSDNSYCNDCSNHHGNKSAPSSRQLKHPDNNQERSNAGLTDTDTSNTSGVVNSEYNENEKQMNEHTDMHNRRDIPLRFSSDGRNDSVTPESPPNQDNNTTDNDTSEIPKTAITVDGDTNKVFTFDNVDNKDGQLLRRRSYTSAIENETCSVEEVHIARNRSFSFQSAIEQGQLSPTGPPQSNITSSVGGNTTPDNDNESTDCISWNTAPQFSSTPLPVNKDSKSAQKSMNFNPQVCMKSVYKKPILSEQFESSLSIVKDTQEPADSIAMSLRAELMKSGGLHPIRESPCSSHRLSVLLEEDAAGDPESPYPLSTSDGAPSRTGTSCHPSSYLGTSPGSRPDDPDFSPEVWTLSHGSAGSHGDDIDRSSSRSPGDIQGFCNGYSSSPLITAPPDVCERSPSAFSQESKRSGSQGSNSPMTSQQYTISGSPILSNCDSAKSDNESDHKGTKSEQDRTKNLNPENLDLQELTNISTSNKVNDITEPVISDIQVILETSDNTPKELDTSGICFFPPKTKVKSTEPVHTSPDGAKNRNILQNSVKKLSPNMLRRMVDNSARNMSPSERILQRFSSSKSSTFSTDVNNGVGTPDNKSSSCDITSPETAAGLSPWQPDAGLTLSPRQRVGLDLSPNLSPRQNSGDVLEESGTGASLKILGFTREMKKAVLSQDVPTVNDSTDGSLPSKQGSDMKMKGPLTDQQSDNQTNDDNTMESNNNRKNNQVLIAEEEIDLYNKSSGHNDAANLASNLAKIRESHLAKRRDNLRQQKMPQLSELSEKDTTEDMDSGLHVDIHIKDDVMRPPTPNGDVIMPSIPDEFLQKLGLNSDDVNSDELSEQEIESKFSSLSLAFKTDAQTLEKRLEIQERSRDIAEQNVDKELQGLRNGLAKLNQLCTDPQVREILSKIQNHIDILEKSTARVSSRAEVFGAIQQEKRMSRAVDIMVHHVENIRRVHEKEHAELEEARKLLQDSRSLAPSALDLAGGDMLSRRSASVCPNNMFMGKSSPLGSPSGGVTPSAVKAIKLMKASRRRVSEIALPKVLGGSGANLHPSASMDICFTEPRALNRYPNSLRSDNSIEEEDEGNNLNTAHLDTESAKDARSRFQAVVASTTVKSAITNTLRRASLEKQNRVQSVTPSNTPPQVSRDNSSESSKITELQDKEKQKSLEEDAFKKGYEQGMRASLGKDLAGLREQQNHINESIGEVMDSIDNQMEEPKSLKEIMLQHVHKNIPKFTISGWRIRMTMGGFFIVMAILSIIVSLFPVRYASPVGYQHFGQPPV